MHGTGCPCTVHILFPPWLPGQALTGGGGILGICDETSQMLTVVGQNVTPPPQKTH